MDDVLRLHPRSGSPCSELQCSFLYHPEFGWHIFKKTWPPINVKAPGHSPFDTRRSLPKLLRANVIAREDAAMDAGHQSTRAWAWAHRTE